MSQSTIKLSRMRLRPARVLSLLCGILFLFSTGLGGCSNSQHALTEPQMQKLDPALQRLVRGESRGMDRYSTFERDEVTVYSVILRSNNPEALRKADLPLNSVQGDVITARLSITQLRTAARLDAVRRIENPTETTPKF